MAVEFLHKVRNHVRYELEPLERAKVRKLANAVSAGIHEGELRHRLSSTLEGNVSTKKIQSEVSDARMNTICAMRGGISQERTLFFFSKKIKLPSKISY